MRKYLAAPLLLVALLTPTPGDGLRAQAPAAKTGVKNKKALLVGIDDYDNRKLDKLKYAERDVLELAGLLKGAGYEVRLLLGSGKGRDEATRRNVEAALADLLKGASKKDTLLLAFSGHGVQLFVDEGSSGGKDRKEQPFFCPKDGVPSDAGTLISISSLLRAIDDKGGGNNLLLIDACREVVDPNKGKRGGIDSSRVENLGEGTAVFLACSSRQRARETELAGGGHGVFFHFVLEGLKGGAANDKGEVTWERLVPYVKSRVKEDFPRMFEGLPESERQKPQAIGNLSDDPVLVAGLKVKPGPTTAPPPAPKTNEVEITTSTASYRDREQKEVLTKVVPKGTKATLIEADEKKEMYLLRFKDGADAWVPKSCCSTPSK